MIGLERPFRSAYFGALARPTKVSLNMGRNVFQQGQAILLRNRVDLEAVFCFVPIPRRFRLVLKFLASHLRKQPLVKAVSFFCKLNISRFVSWRRKNSILKLISSEDH